MFVQSFQSTHEGRLRERWVVFDRYVHALQGFVGSTNNNYSSQKKYKHNMLINVVQYNFQYIKFMP